MKNKLFIIFYTLLGIFFGSYYRMIGAPYPISFTFISSISFFILALLVYKTRFKLNSSSVLFLVLVGIILIFISQTFSFYTFFLVNAEKVNFLNINFDINDDFEINLFNTLYRSLIVGLFSILSPGFITFPIAILLIVFYLKTKKE